MTVLDDAMAVLQALRLEDGRRWGDAAVAVQIADARAVLSHEGPRRHWLGRARGYSKSTDVAGLLVVLLLVVLRHGSECVAAAADSDQASILVRKMRGLINRSGLSNEFDVTSRRVTCKSTGSFVEIVPADGAGAWGWTPAVVVLDEFPMWRSTDNAKEVFEALTSALPKSPGSRLIVMGTAGDPASWPARERERALADPETWRVSEPAGPPPWMSETDLEVERRARIDSAFERLFLNRWVEGPRSLTNPAQVRLNAQHSGPLAPVVGRSYQMSLDIGLVHDRSVLTVAHLERRDGRSVVVVDRQVTWQGRRDRPVPLAEVEEVIYLASREYNRAPLVCDPWNAALLCQHLRSRGVSVREFSFTPASIGKLASVLYKLLRDVGLDLDADDEQLLTELSTVRLVESAPNVFRLDHRASEHDDRAVSLALCSYVLTEKESGPVRLQVPRDSIRRPPIVRTPPSERGARSVGRFTIPNRGYTPPEREGRF